MNWIFIFSILQTIQYSCTAPIEPVPTDQFDVLSREENSLKIGWESVVNTTKMPSFTTNSFRVLDNINKSTSEVQKQLDETTESEPGETNAVTKIAEGKVSDNDAKSYYTYYTTLKTLIEITNTEDPMQETTYSNKLQSDESSSTETPKLFPSRADGEDEKLTTSSTFQSNIEIQETTSFVPESHEELQRTPAFKQAVTRKILELNDKLDILPDKSSESSTTQITINIGEEDIRKNNYFTTGTPILKVLKRTVQNGFTHTQKITDCTTKNCSRKGEKDSGEEDTTIFNEHTSTIEFDTVNAVTAINSILKENLAKISGEQNFDTTLFTNHNEEDHTAYATESSPENSSTNPALEQTFHSVIYQLSTTERSIEIADAKVANNSSVEQLEVKNSEPQPPIGAGEKKQTPASEQGIDDFIENIVEFKNKLGLTAQGVTDQPAATSNEFSTEDLNQETTTTRDTKFQYENQETLSTTFSSISDLDAQTADNTSEYFQTTTILYENLQENHSKSHMEILMAPAIAESLGEASSKTIEFSTRAKETESVDEAEIKKSRDKINSGEQNTEKLENEQNIKAADATSQQKEIDSSDKRYPVQTAEIPSGTISDTTQSEPSYQTESNKDKIPEQVEAPTMKSGKTQAEETPAQIFEAADNIPLIPKSIVLSSRLTLPKMHKKLQQDIYTIEPTQRNQFKLSTSPDMPVFTTESTTVANVIETTLEMRNFEEDLQTDVTIPEEKTDDQLEIIHNQLQQSLESFEAERESPEQNATNTENPFTSRTEADTSVANSVFEELQHSGVLRQDFIDEFASNYAGSVNASTETELLQVQESSFSFEESTQTTVTSRTTTLPAVEKLKPPQGDAAHTEDGTITANSNKEVLVMASAGNTIGDETTGEMKSSTSEYISETTTQTNIARVSLPKDANSISPYASARADAVASTRDNTTLNQIEIPQTPLELSAETKSTEPEEKTTTLPLPETLLNEMLTFIEVAETTTKTAQLFEEKLQEYRATTEIQKLQTQSHLIQQQQIESTTENATQIESTDANEQTATMTTRNELQTEQQATEAEINSTMVLEEYETTVTPHEPEARSVSLSPPKLDYLQTDEGVEVFYGYSSVKRS